MVEGRRGIQPDYPPHSLPGHLPLLAKIYDSKKQLVQELRQG